MTSGPQTLMLLFMLAMAIVTTVPFGMYTSLSSASWTSVIGKARGRTVSLRVLKKKHMLIRWKGCRERLFRHDDEEDRTDFRSMNGAGGYLSDKAITCQRP